MTRSIRGRVVLLVFVAQLLAAAVAVSLSIGYVQRALWSGFDSELHSRMVAVLALVDQGEKKPDGITFDSDQVNLPPGDLFYIEDTNGQPVAGSSAWMDQRARSPRAAVKPWKFHWNEKFYRARALIQTPILDQENRQVPRLRVNIFYAMPAHRTQDQIESATRIAVGVGLLSLLFSFAATWWAVDRGMRPLTEFARQADAIQPDGAQFQSPPDTVHSAELVPLARALHALVSRLQAAFRRERQFLSDAAHELKTAVAIQKSTLQLLEQGTATAAEYREGIARALEDTSRTEHLVADMLLLASIEHARNAPGNPDRATSATSLNESLFDAIDQLTPMAKMKSVSIDFTPAETLLVPAKESETGQLWRNLIENAIQHSPPNAHVVIDARAVSAAACRVRIADSGSGIASEDLAHVFERFYRSDSSRSRLTGGFGLGLSIAKAIVEKNHGSIRIQSTPGKGTAVDIELPRYIA